MNWTKKIEMQINLDLIELADCETPGSLTNEIFRQNPDITLPINLEKIASEVGITDIRYHSFNGLEGALVANEEKSEGIIVISSDIIPTKQRFTLGHELGHFLLPRHGHRMECTVRDMAKREAGNGGPINIEAEANLFSSRILMPPDIIISRGLLSKVASIENVVALKTTCDVSLQASANNYINLHSEPLAIVCTHNRSILYGLNCESNSLWLCADKRATVPTTSQLRNLDLTRSDCVFRSEAPLNTWFSQSGNQQLTNSILEETYVQEKGYAITLIKINK